MATNNIRENRITNEIIVDAYGPEEQAMGWYNYLEDKLEFPFTAKCIHALEISPLKKGEQVKVIGMAPEADCISQMFVLVEWMERTMGVPLSQLEAVEKDKERREAIADWHYWMEQGYQFC